MEVTNDISTMAKKLLKAFTGHDKQRSFTVGISGIDGSGKGFTSKRLQEKLEQLGYNVANINIDPWQNPVTLRLKKENAAENVYDNIFRWDQFFGQLILPLQKNKGVYLETEGIRSDADIYYPLIYDHTDLDILFIEGILLFKREYLLHYDYKIWIDCSFETALQRAIQRNAEKLDEVRLIHDYETYYYAAQRLHFERDDPQKAADLIFDNDPVLSES
jgi:uridine kinase